MNAKKSQRRAALGLFGIIAAVYLVNIIIFTLPAQRQLTAGGLVLIALGALWIFLLGAPETLSCDRLLDTCRLTRPRFLLTPKSVITLPLDSVSGASVRETYIPSHDGPGRTGYEVSLKTADGRFHVISIEDGARSADAVARRVEAFLADDARRSLKVRRFSWTMIAVGGASIIFGASLVVGGAAG